ncbi:hypothetical protein SFRURICE_020281 [Spodoptera frugiperda]|nr:hypothetical protein SFRURICE_020281 [Spodoptera frugiperda]
MNRSRVTIDIELYSSFVLEISIRVPTVSDLSCPGAVIVIHSSVLRRFARELKSRPKMGKRSRTEPSEYESLAKKFKKLEEKLLRARRKDRHTPRRRLSSTSSSSSCTSCSSSGSSAGPRRSPAARSQPYQEQFCIEGVPTIDYVPQPSTSAAPHVAPPPQPPQCVVAPPPAVPSPPPTPPPGSTVADAIPDSQPDLAVRLQHMATSGLSKETRKELSDRYLIPANCTLIDAPLLNPEIKAAVSETVHKRDKELAETLKAAKAITKTGDDMKPMPPKQPAKKVINPKVQKNHLNWRAPPQSHRSKGTQRRKEPALRNQHETSSRQSSRPAASRSRR